jgi:hypothetical protein
VPHLQRAARRATPRRRRALQQISESRTSSRQTKAQVSRRPREGPPESV